jgi:hypothetical protein
MESARAGCGDGITSDTTCGDTIRARLQTANSTHTVAKALALGLINMSYEPAHLIPKKRG